MMDLDLLHIFSSTVATQASRERFTVKSTHNYCFCRFVLNKQDKLKDEGCVLFQADEPPSVVLVVVCRDEQEEENKKDKEQEPFSPDLYSQAKSGVHQILRRQPVAGR